jgi:cytochrome c-type biogenesis protein CcmH
MKRAALLVVLTLPLLALSPATGRGAAPPPGAVNEETVRGIAAQLRCVVCQNLSVADSPSEMANQMRGIIRERLVAGDSPEQVVAYFVEKYGEWILLSPLPRGFNLLVWVLPFAGLAGGFVAVLIMARRWARRTAGRPAADKIEPAVRERIRREMAELEP